MQTSLIIAGFGGQGVMFIGKLIAYAALHENKEVCWLPSYGPEMRGGTSNCSIVVSDKPIGSPVISTPMHSVVLNRPSLEKFAPKLKTGGLLVINSSLIDIESPRDDITQMKIDANKAAIALGAPKMANMVILGAYLAKTNVVSLDSVIEIMQKQLASRQELLDINIKTLRKGESLIEH